MRLIPAIDIIDGKCVRLSQGDYDQKKVYDQSPIEIAKELEKKGYEYLHLVDLDGAKSSRPHNLYVLNQIALETNLKIDFGGGIKSEDSLVQSLRSGAHQINIGSLAVRNPNLVKFWLLRYSPEQIVIGADVKEAIDARKVDDVWLVHTHGGSKPTELKLMEWAQKMEELGAGEILFTSMDHDGTKAGFACEALAELNDLLTIPVIASGGAGSIEHFEDVFTKGMADAGLAASIFHFNEIPIPNLKKVLNQAGVPMRL
ncbi:UNVERIFIED_CONTAM: hypothetical protein GTU68_016675 [Idotea baltica]|nr:hypothetical protein [Idotea baltica]